MTIIEPARYPVDPRCGRIKAVDNRDKNFPLMESADINLVELAPERMWQMYGKYSLNQGSTPMCVGYSLVHGLAAAPKLRPYSEDVAVQVYHGAQLQDEWPGENYDGTSVRGGVKAAIQMGLAEPVYRWALREIDVNIWVRLHGAIQTGTEWLWGMLDTDEDGYVHPTGGSVGGHAWLIIGYDMQRDAYRGLNSWGTGWGQGGRFWIKRSDYRFLLEDLGGEAVSFTEK